MKRLLPVMISLILGMGTLLMGCSGSNKDNAAATASGSTPAPTQQSSPSAAAGASDGSMPISKDPIELKMVRLNWPDIRPNAGETWMWKKFSEMSNIKVNWEELPITSYTEKLKLKLATGDLPDAFYQMIFSQDQIVQQAQAGNLIPLDDLIDKNAPNIKKMFESDPAVKKAVTLPDGHVYSLPYVEYDKNSAAVRFYINKNWLDSLGLGVPKTISELTDALKAFKAKDPSNIPISVPKGNDGIFLQTFLGAYGLGNRGVAAAGQYIDMGPDGKVRFFPADDRYKEMLQQMHEWYKDGLYAPDFFTGTDVAKWQENGKNNKVGLFAWVTPNYIGEEAQNNFTGISQFAGPHGDDKMSWIDASVRGIWSFMITNKDKHPVETIKWADYWYSEAGTMFANVGLPGETYDKDSSGKYQFIGAVADSIKQKGLQVGAFQHLERWYGGFEPQIHGMKLSDENQKIMNDLTQAKTPQQTYLIDPEDYKKHMPDEIWPGFIPSAEENDQIGSLFTDLNTYMLEMNTKFIMGKANFTDGWDNYIKTLEKMGYKKYLQTKQAQYERYAQSK